MTRRADWFAFHATIDPIDTADALQAALADPQQRWYGLRRVNALAAAGLVGPSWNPNMHPRGRDGKFIEKFGWVRWFDTSDQKWHTGWVSDINPGDGTITVRSGGDKLSGISPKTLYSRPKPKALLDLPDPTDPSKLPDNFVKVGGQGGSNPGGLYQIDGSFANDPPDISKRSKMFTAFTTFRQPATYTHLGDTFKPGGPAESAAPTDIDVAIVPRIDGTKDRYEVVQRFGTDWYRVPNDGPMTVDDTMRPELKVSPADLFGEPGSDRRQRVIADPGTQGITRGTAYDVEDFADMVQQVGSPLPKVGDKYYVKKMNIPERARSEALANDFYELLGVPVPDVAVGSDGTTISSKLVGDTIDFDPDNPAHVKAAQGGFVADAWLANWDVIGLTFDNVQIDSHGNAWRIDAGGSLEWRAQGKAKGAMFGNDVGELASLRNPTINSQASKVYGNITQAQLVEQAVVLQSISPSQIQVLADTHDMGHLGTVLIARRKSILDQVDITDPPVSASPLFPGQTPADIHTQLTTPKAPTQIGTPPAVAVHNYALSIDALPSTKIDATDWGDEDLYLLNNGVFKHDGDLWVYDSDGTKVAVDAHAGLFRNLFTDEKKRLTLYDGEDEFLDLYTTANVDTLVENATPTRDLAVAEIVARTSGTPLGQLSAFNVNHDGDPNGMRYNEVGMGNFNALRVAWERGRLGPTGPEGAADRPLYNGKDDSLWEITDFGDDGMKLKRRAGVAAPVNWMQDQVFIGPDDFAANGPWYIPSNDTTAAVWKSKYAPDSNTETDPDGIGLHQDSAIAAKQQDVDDILALLDPADDPSLDIPGDDGTSDAVGGDAMLAEIESSTDAELEALIAAEEAIAAANAPTSDQKITNDVVAGLGAGIPLLSTEMALSDIDTISAQLLNKPVIVLPIEAHDNPDWAAADLGVANGLGTVISVEQKQSYKAGGYVNGIYQSGSYEDVVALKVSRPFGGFSWVIAGDSAKFKKVVIPVETQPTGQHVVFKQNGDIFINGEKAGTYWKPYSHPAGYDHVGYPRYSGVIDGDHSLTGKPLAFSANKKADVKNAAGSLVVPVTPKPTTPKSTKVIATEAEIKDLNVKLGYTAIAIEDIQQQLDDLAKGAPAGPGNPLSDGSTPVKGDWVFSTKDGSYAQVLNPNVVGFAGKGVLSPDMIKVKIQDPATGKWKQSNRKRDTLVSAAAPGDTPFILTTKAKQTKTGQWFGPGTGVLIDGKASGAGFPADVTVLDTTVDDKVKYVDVYGAQHWTSTDHIVSTSVGVTAPKLKNTAAPGGNADALNAELAALNDEHTKLAAAIANTVVGKPKKKKEIGVPFPGPGGMTVKQSKGMAEAREAKGLKNMKDGYFPTPGMVMRHNDGTQYVVVEMGDDWSSHKNSVFVAPVGSPYDTKWRAVSTMVVDHEAMLTDTNGTPLPIVSSVEGADWLPSHGLIIRRDVVQGYYTSDPLTGKSVYRKKEMSKFYVVDEYGDIFNLDGTKTYSSAITGNTTRIGYIDNGHPGGKKLTVSIQPHHNDQIGKVEYAVIHDTAEPAGIPLAKQAAPEPPSAVPTVKYPANTSVFNPQTGNYEDVPPVAPTPVAAPEEPEAPEAPEAPSLPTPEPTPTDALPVFVGTDPVSMEMPHPPTTTSSAGVPVPQIQGGTPTLDVAALPGTKAVTAAIADTIAVTKQNKQNGERKWVGTYGLADHDVIEDMMVRSQTVTDAKGTEYVEVSFRIEKNPARDNFNKFITSSTNQAGDWAFNGRNAKNMVPGDQIRVRVASGGGSVPKGALRPEDPDKPQTPNATVVAPPVLIGKNAAYGSVAAGTLDVYRTQVLTAGGDIGFIDLEDRNGLDSVMTATWDPTIPRMTSGSKGINPNAQADGWSVKSNRMTWNRANSTMDAQHLNADGSKKAPTETFHQAKGYTLDSGEGFVLQRDYDGTHIEYSTSPIKNTLDGHTVIRVRADDPDAQRKIADAMELVGVTREKQQPPTREAIMQMAADKVYEQFNPTYSRGMTANGGIQQALDAIDKAVGPYMPDKRKATIDDISVRVSPDGRVQVLVSEDVSRAIVKKNGIKTYTHDFMATDYETMLEQMVDGDQIGLMSSSERWQHGLMYVGMSSAGDHPKDAADHMFLRMSDKSTSSGNQVHIDPVVLHRHVDYYYQLGDNYGNRGSDQLNWLNTPKIGGTNELMVQRRIEASLIGRVYLESYKREQIIKSLHAKGITQAPNGMPLEDFFAPSGTAVPFAAPKFGDEILLSALPDTLPAAPVLVTV